MALKIVNNITQFIQRNVVAADRAANRMAVDIERLAKATVPVKEGQLKASGRHTKRGMLKYTIVFNKEYAAYQEWGGDGKRVIRNYTTPGTGKFFLKNAVEKVIPRAFNYFSQEAGRIFMEK